MATHEYNAIREEIRKIVNDVVRPNADRVDRDGTFPRADRLDALWVAGKPQGEMNA